jgi:hypothetical protein
MEKRIINLTVTDEGHKCLICCENQATIKIVISRPKYDDNINSFFVCNNCLAQMQKDIEMCK